MVREVCRVALFDCRASPRSPGSSLGNGENVFLVAPLKEERGFIEVQLLATYMVVFVTILAFTLGLCFGVWKQAWAKYGWVTEAANFAAQAANKTGDIKEVKLNEGKAKRYFESAMRQTVKDYRLDGFRAVGPGEPVPGGGYARAPGYVVSVTVPVFEANIPILGYQKVDIPMRYYAVVKSGQIRKK